MPKTGRPKRAEWEKCLVESCMCTTQNGAKGLCRTHYMQLRRGIITEHGVPLRQPKRIRSYGEGARCIYPDCGNRPIGHGYCSKHYQSLRDQLPYVTEKVAPSYDHAQCIVDGCDLRPVNRWMCHKHHSQREAGIIDENGKRLRDPKAYRSSRKPGPIFDGHGYALVPAPDGYAGPVRDGRRVLEHRLVMEQVLGRPLETHELVHHKNGNRSDNRPENLVLMDGRAKHGEGHPPGSEMCPLTAMQVLVQRDDCPDHVRSALSSYRDLLVGVQ
jgi:hypothetical protein